MLRSTLFQTGQSIPRKQRGFKCKLVAEKQRLQAQRAVGVISGYCRKRHSAACGCAQFTACLEVTLSSCGTSGLPSVTARARVHHVGSGKESRVLRIDPQQITSLQHPYPQVAAHLSAIRVRWLQHRCDVCSRYFFCSPGMGIMIFLMNTPL